MINNFQNNNIISKISSWIKEFNNLELFEKYSNYLSIGIPNFYDNLINGKVDNFNPNGIDGLITKKIIELYYGLNSNESNKINDFLKGTKNDIKWIYSGLNDILSITKSFKEPLIEKDGKLINELVDPNCYKIPNNCKIILLSDWAIGTKQAYDVISKINILNPDYLIYLGDVYYSGTKNEFDTNFFKPLENLNKLTKIFFIPGNHDYYSGSRGIYYCLDKIGQNATYFSIYNDYFQFEGFDTGYNDSTVLNQINIIKSNTFLEKTENDWHFNRIIVSSV